MTSHKEYEELRAEEARLWAAIAVVRGKLWLINHEWSQEAQRQRAQYLGGQTASNPTLLQPHSILEVKKLASGNGRECA